MPLLNRELICSPPLPLLPVLLPPTWGRDVDPMLCGSVPFKLSCPVNVITMESYQWVVKSPTGLIPPQSLYMRESAAK